MNNSISGVILAGGRATRMGGTQKALQIYRDKRLLDWVIESLKPQVQDLMININVPAELYSEYPYQLIYDIRNNFPGPLAGIESALSKCSNEYLVVVPCDMPNLCDNFVSKLIQPLLNNNKLDLVVASDKVHLQPTCLITRKSTLSSLNNCLDRGNSSIKSWINQLNYTKIEFADDMFININEIWQLNL